MNGGLVQGSNPRVQTQAANLSAPDSIDSSCLYIEPSTRHHQLNLQPRRENMAVRTTCCLNLSSPGSGSTLPSSSAKNSQVAWFRNEKWRNRFVLGTACMIIGLEVGCDSASGENLAVAREMQVAVESKENLKGPRWSDKRMCPPWTQNSLETIVPENLPRPSAHRRWEVVGFSNNNAPAVKVIVIKRSNGCFSM